MWASAVTPPRSRTRHAHRATPPGDSVSETKPTTVCECGSVSPFTHVHRDPSDPLSKSKVIEFTNNLSQTLDTLSDEARDHGMKRLSAKLSCDEDLLFDVVRSLKSRPEYQFRDDDILRTAVEVACGPDSHEEETVQDGNRPTEP